MYAKNRNIWLSCSYFAVTVTLAVTQATAAERKWALVEKNVLAAQQDSYVDLNSRQILNNNYASIVSLWNGYSLRPVTIFAKGRDGRDQEVTLPGKYYRSIINTMIFNCKKREFTTTMSYRSGFMGNGYESYNHNREIYLPVVPKFLAHKEFLFACYGIVR
jgi:hypothetical protein